MICTHIQIILLTLNLFYWLDYYEVLYTLDHTLDDCRVLVLYRLVDLAKTQSIEILTLLLGCTDTAANLCDFQFHKTSLLD